MDTSTQPRSAGVPGLLGAARHAWLRHPGWSLAAKGAVAATLAWFAGTLAPAPLSQYPYYAPLGAVVAATGTVVRSIRHSVQSVAAVLAGAFIARAVDLLPVPDVVKLALVVGLALLCVGARVFGDQGPWVAMAAVFVLIIGDGNPHEYVAAYAGLILVGASIGIGINLLFPPLPLTPSERALDRLRDGLVEQLEALADWLENEGPLEPEEWERRRRRLIPVIESARAAVARSREASRANRRLQRNRDRVAAQVRRSAALQTAAEAVDEIVRLLVDWESSGRDDLALGRRLRPAFAATLRHLAAALHSADAPSVARLDRSLHELRDVVRDTQRSSEQDHFVAGALIVTLKRAADALDQ
ncbi:aromatic acid exporter family protein [Microlunatus parietis]|uniref:Uncharacterized membrane protein YgaE (UPF0421/DUF939 family) n=1 Tax=Microlunatus parietis TaxID=682979 RepID=A0A7Y9IBK4_9ACTN|nr:hypothetical protein [Microlunatus parietis]NYE73901.1 uncharacterized membrane protein YgaE (UPF0421/DUF939 family) [Microlunatus parietis]